MKVKMLVALIGSLTAGMACAATTEMFVDIQGPGGHSFGAYSRTNAVHAASRAMMEIERAIPDESQCLVSDFNGGNSVNSIAANGHFKVTLTAKDDQALKALKAKVEAAVKTGVEKENAFRNVKPGDMTAGVPAAISYKIR